MKIIWPKESFIEIIMEWMDEKEERRGGGGGAGWIWEAKMVKFLAKFLKIHNQT